MARPRPWARRAMLRKLIMGGALLVAAFASVKLFLSTSKDQHTLKFQHTSEDLSADSRADSGSTAAGSKTSKESGAASAVSQTGSHPAHFKATKPMNAAL